MPHQCGDIGPETAAPSASMDAALEGREICAGTDCERRSFSTARRDAAPSTLPGYNPFWLSSATARCPRALHEHRTSRPRSRPATLDTYSLEPTPAVRANPHVGPPSIRALGERKPHRTHCVRDVAPLPF
ncbi:hypothetical protein PsYK624_125690 [Phanerochaete sordida]|uniref:Uncharacterized protein n=1 Tax=Phanerochaete sordida TaxID=48140 RepID=A0A9P3GLD3_9APHY|nr:hypothetical protein PsYK624_125690 [Phanerochaete sordida]